MARRKFRHSQRKSSSEHRSYKEFLTNQPAPLTTRTEILRLIRGGEDTFLELKLKLSNPDRIAQEIVALANTAGGTMIFGVSDQLRVEGVRNPEGVQEELAKICREKIVPSLIPYTDVIAFDNGNRIVALEIAGKNPPYRTQDGKFFIRVGAEKRETSRDELSGLIGETRPLRFENIPVYGLTEDDFDDSLLWSFADGFAGMNTKRSGYDTQVFLRRDLLLALGGDEFIPTVAGVLLFGKSQIVSRSVPNSKVRLVRVSSSEDAEQIVESREVEGNLLELNEQVMEFIGRYCDLYKHPQKYRQEDKEPVVGRGSYHLYAVREAVSNLLIHRDLVVSEVPSEVRILDRSIEFSNPRRTNGFTPPASKAIRFGITQQVNPQIAKIFMRREYGANVPQGGLPMILKQSELFSRKKCELRTTGDRFRLIIHSAK